MTVPSAAPQQSSDLPNWRGVQSARAPSTGKTRPQASRSKSQPKQRNAKPKAKPTALELGVAQARATVDGASPEQLEARLQQLLRTQQYADAAYLIAASEHLRARFQTADVVRLMLEQVSSPRSLEQAAQLVRDLQLKGNDELMTLLINEMVRATQFSAAVRVAQEMVPNFESLSGAATEKPSWTPPALVQAMVRAGKFRAALKFSKQFGLLETFPAPQLVAGMLETRCWEEAVSSVMEFQLFQEFPLEALAVRMMQMRQWAQAVKCINKLADSDTRAKFQEALVREMAHVGDFVTALTYLREFRLDQGNGDATVSLLRFLVDAMVAHGEFYKAIKYAIKFKLAKNPLDDAIAAAEAALAAANGETLPPMKEDDVEYLPQYSAESLIRKAIDGGQYHVATTYIKKLRLRGHFEEELVEIEKAQQIRLQEFRQYAQLRLGQFEDPASQQTLQTLLGPEANDEMVELDPIEVEIVLSTEEEVFPRKEKAPKPVVEEAVTQEAVDANKEKQQEETDAAVEEQRPKSPVREETAGQSRFGFARSTSPVPPPPPSAPAPPLEVPSSNNDDQVRSKSVPYGRSAPPPGLFQSAEPQSTENGNTVSSVSGFNFADFAKSVQVNGPLPPTSAPASQPLQSQQQPQQAFINQSPQPPQQNPTMFNQPMPPMPNDPFAGGGYGVPPSPMMPQQNMYFPRGNMSPGAMMPNQQRGYPQPPPPSISGDALSVAALAMQFHNAGSSNGSSGFGSFGAPRPPMGYPGGQQLYPGMPPPPFGAPPLPPQSTFKPSMAYTSVTTTRKK